MCPDMFAQMAFTFLIYKEISKKKMKKFSNITNQKVGQEPVKKETKINEEEAFAQKLLNLMDECLRIQTYGPVDRYLRAGTIKIQGKEALVAAIMEALGEKSVKEATKLLESLKSKSSDWTAIDERIEEIQMAENESNRMTDDEKKIANLVDKFGDDTETLQEAAKANSLKIKSSESASERAATAQKMFEKGMLDLEQKEILKSTYEERANLLSGKI